MLFTLTSKTYGLNFYNFSIYILLLRTAKNTRDKKQHRIPVYKPLIIKHLQKGAKHTAKGILLARKRCPFEMQKVSFRWNTKN